MGLMLIGVSKSLGSFQAIKDLSMEVREGVLFGFLGPNGAGKTTTMRMILDLFRPGSGQITWNGIPVHEVTRRSFGYLPEERRARAEILARRKELAFIPLEGGQGFLRRPGSAHRCTLILSSSIWRLS